MSRSSKLPLLFISNIFVDQGEFSDPDFISGTHQRENAQFANEIRYRVSKIKLGNL